METYVRTGMRTIISAKCPSVMCSAEHLFCRTIKQQQILTWELLRTLTLGVVLTCSNVKSVTSECSTTESSAQFSCLCARVISCCTAVRKPCGLKKPVIQKETGRPVASHCRYCASRWSRPEYHTPRLGVSHVSSSPAGLRKEDEI